MTDPLFEKATELQNAALQVQAAIESQDPDHLLEALEIREGIFDALLSVPTDEVSSETERLVGEILEIDQAAMAACKKHMDRIRGELAEIRHARDVVSRQNRSDEGPRFVSRRA